MSQHLPNPRDLGRYLALAQVGMEMVAPIVLGLLLDFFLGWLPWATVVGAVLGLVGGVAHLIQMQRRMQEKDRTKHEQDTQ